MWVILKVSTKYNRGKIFHYQKKNVILYVANNII